METTPKKGMKTWLKITLIVLLVLFVVVAALAIWQWKNIKSIYVGLTETPRQITQRRNENQKNLINDVKEYMDYDIRDLTKEEKAKIESGELLAENVYAEIFAEKNEEIREEKKTNKNDSPKRAKDEIVSDYMARLYSLQSEYTAKAEVTISQGAAYYENLKKTKSKADARQGTIDHFTPIVRGVESECDAKVEELISGLTKELENIGEKNNIEDNIRNTYQNEKQLKLSYYVSKYL